jgi:DNA primase
MSNEVQQEVTRAVIEEIKDNIDPHGLLVSLGFDVGNGRETMEEIRCPCIIHGGDNVTSFRFKKTSKTYSCFSHGCHEEHGHDIIALVRAVLNCGFIESLEYLSSLCGVNFKDRKFTDEEINLFHAGKMVKEIRRNRGFELETQGAQPIEIEWAASHIQRFIRDRDDYFLNRGFLRETLDLFEIGTTSYFEEGLRETIPVKDENDILVGISARIGREFLEEDKGKLPKYRILKDFDKMKHLYSLNNAKRYTSRFNDTLVLVEGFTDVWRLWEADIPVGVACMGTSLSDIQRYLISKHSFQVLVMLDGDEAGRLGTKRVCKKLEGFVKIISFNKEGMEPSKYTREDLNKIVTDLIY